MREKSPRSNLRKRLLILRKKLERTASFPKKLFLGISLRRLILPPNSLRAAPFGAASKPLLLPTKNHEVQFGVSLQFGSNSFYPKFLNETRPRKPPRRRSLTLASQQKSFLCISDFARARFFLLKGKENFFAGFCL